jgi:hypothetical protein
MSVKYTKPTPLWRLTHPDGRLARATLFPHGYGFTFSWRVDETVRGVQEFHYWQPAIKRADRLRRELMQDGWRDAS